MNVLYSLIKKFLDAWEMFANSVKRVYAYLRTFKKHRIKVWVKQQTIARECKCSLSTVVRALRSLKKFGFIKVINRGANKSCLYEMTEETKDIDFFHVDKYYEIAQKPCDDATDDATDDARIKKEESFYIYRNDKKPTVVNNVKKIVMTDKEKEIVRERFSRLYLYDERYQSMGGHVDAASLEKMMIYNSFEAMMGVAEAYIIEFKRKLRDGGRPIGNGEAWIQKSLMNGTWRNVLRIEANRKKAFGGLGKFGRFVKRMTSYFVEFMNGSRIELDTNSEIFDSHFEHNKRINTGVYC